MVETVKDIEGIEIVGDKNCRIKKATVVAKNGNRVELNPDKEMVVEIDDDENKRFVEVTATTKHGNKVVLNLEKEMVAMMLLFLSDEEVENDD